VLKPAVGRRGTPRGCACSSAASRTDRGIAQLAVDDLGFRSPGAGFAETKPRRCSGWSDSSSTDRESTLPDSVMPSIVCRNSGSAQAALPGAMIGYRFSASARDDRVRGPGRLGWPCQDGRSPPRNHLSSWAFRLQSDLGSRRQSVALEHTNVEAGETNVARNRERDSADPKRTASLQKQAVVGGTTRGSPLRTF